MKAYFQISVIVVTYNQEKTIGRTLDAILRQECHLPFEIVVGEDCSTDGTKAICQDYARQYPDRIRLFCNAQNKGVVNNYMDCLLACKGELIADCAGDDFWTDPLKLEKASRIMEANPDVTLVHTAWCYYNEQTHATTPSPAQPFTAAMTDGKDMLEAIITQTRRPVIHLCTALYRADTAKESYHKHTAWFRHEDVICEDLQIAYLMAKNGRIAYLPDVTLNYNQGEETVSTPTDAHRQFVFCKKATQLSYWLSEDYGHRRKRIESYFCQRIFELGMYAFRAHSRELYKETLACEKDWNVNRSMKNSLLFMVMNNEWLWKMGLTARKVFVRLKQAAR